VTTSSGETHCEPQCAEITFEAASTELCEDATLEVEITHLDTQLAAHTFTVLGDVSEAQPWSAHKLPFLMPEGKIQVLFRRRGGAEECFMYLNHAFIAQPSGCGV